MPITYLVQEGIWDSRASQYLYRTAAEFENDRQAAEHFAATYPAARILRAVIVHEHDPRSSGRNRVFGPDGEDWL